MWFEGARTRHGQMQYCERKHVNLEDLKEHHNQTNGYLGNHSIPLYPHPVLFKVPKVCHVTGQTGLKGIFQAGGFKAFNQSKLHWSLSVMEEDINEAQNCYLVENNLQSHDNYLLSRFTKSPAFQDESRYGNFRFTFSLRQLLNLYSKQFCEYTPPVLRILNTELYKQEIMYTILVHPKYMWHYNKYPRLPVDEDSLCGYRDGMVFWQCQSPADKYTHRLKTNYRYGEVYAEQLRNPKYFVWDHVTVVFHVKPKQTLRIPRKWLIDSVEVCKLSDEVNLSLDGKLSVPEATEILENLKEEYSQSNI